MIEVTSFSMLETGNAKVDIRGRWKIGDSLRRMYDDTYIMLAVWYSSFDDGWRSVVRLSRSEQRILPLKLITVFSLYSFVHTKVNHEYVVLDVVIKSSAFYCGKSIENSQKCIRPHFFDSKQGIDYSTVL